MGCIAQVPSHGALPADGTPDVIRAPEVVMWNLPIAHNKSSERWKNVRPASQQGVFTFTQPGGACGWYCWWSSLMVLIGRLIQRW